MTVLLFLASNIYADPDKATTTSYLAWRGDALGDYTFQETCTLTSARIGSDRAAEAPTYQGTIELNSPYITKGAIQNITANWFFTGEVTLQISTTGKPADYIETVNGVPIELAKAKNYSRLRLSNKVLWKATLVPGSKLSEVRIAYQDTSGVIGSFGTPELTGFMFRKPIHIKGGEAELFHYQVPIRVGESRSASGADVVLKGVIQASFKDARFTQADGETLIPHWLEDVTGSQSNRIATYWVRIPQIPKGGIHIFMYYGNSSAIDASDGEATFDFFDDFREGSLDTTKWKATLLGETSTVSVTYNGLKLDRASVTTKAFNIKDGIIEYKAKASPGGAIVGIIRGSDTHAGTQMAYSSGNSGSEHAVTVGDDVKANTASGITADKYSSIVITAGGENIKFERYNADKSNLEAKTEYRVTGGLKEGYIGLSTSSQGAGAYYDRILVRKYSSSPPQVNTTRTAASHEEAPNIASFKNLSIAPDGNLVLERGETQGEYISPLVYSPFKARIVTPSWIMEKGDIKVDFSATEYGLFKEGCKNDGFYYSSKKDFAEGDTLRWRAGFKTQKEKGETVYPSLESLTMDFRPGRIRLISPNGGEYVVVGEDFTIKWDATDYGPKYDIKLEYSTNGGINYSLITNAAKNSGRYSWKVPDSVTGKAVARVSDPYAASIYDASNNYFNIVYEIPEGEEVAAEEGEEEDAAEEEEEAVEEVAEEGPVTEYVGRAKGYWHDPSNWSGGAIPDINTTVVLRKQTTLTADRDIGFKFLTIGDGTGTNETRLIVKAAFQNGSGAITVQRGGTLVQASNKELVLLGDLKVDSDGVFTHEKNKGEKEYYIDLTAENITVSPEGVVFARGTGFAGGGARRGGFGQGSGRTILGRVGSGGSHGGKGGEAEGEKEEKYLIYDELRAPKEYGSGGAGGLRTSGGAGGGIIHLTSRGNFSISGKIIANGEDGELSPDGKSDGGGGAGGSIYLIADYFTGRGAEIYAKGGSGNISGGGGGGGRINVIGQGGIIGKVNVNGGQGFKRGEAGSVVFE